MNEEALRQLIRVADNIPAAEFNMFRFSGPAGRCLLSHAAEDSWFVERGWVFSQSTATTIPYMVPHLKDLPAVPMDSIVQFFAITPAQAKRIFYSAALYAKTKADQVRELLKVGELQ